MSYLKYGTVARIHKKLPAKCSVHKLLEFTHNTNVGFSISRKFRILHTSSVVANDSYSLSREHVIQVP